MCEHSLKSTRLRVKFHTKEAVCFLPLAFWTNRFSLKNVFQAFGLSRVIFCKSRGEEVVGLAQDENVLFQ